MHSDVIVVGGGPVGLGLAIDLALRGVRSSVVEQTSSLHDIPKGQHLTQRTGEHFRTWGVSQRIRETSIIRMVHCFVYHSSVMVSRIWYANPRNIAIPPFGVVLAWSVTTLHLGHIHERSPRPAFG